jgi:hypothetical protein
MLLTLFPLSIDPLVPIQPLKVKYLTPLMPLAIFILVLGISHGVNRANPGNRKSLFIGINILALVFLAWSVVFESPFKYQFRHKQYPAKDALLWKYDDLNQALRAGYGVCASKTIPIIKVQNMIRNYMNHDGLIKEIGISVVDDYKVLHVSIFNPENLKGYFHYSNLEKTISAQECSQKQ